MFRSRSARVGITTRLAGAFIAVAVLAVAANFFVDRSRVVVKTTSVRVIKVPRTEQPTASAWRAAPGSTSSVADVATAARSLEAFGRTATTRFDNATAAVVLDADKASRALNLEMTALRSSASAFRDPPAVRRFASDVQAQRRDANDLTALGDRARAYGDEYRATFEELDAHLKAALGNAWKFLGRVIARQSLVDLTHVLDDARPALIELASLEAGAVAPVGLGVLEARLAQILDRHRAGLLRSQGDAWLTTTETLMTDLARGRAGLQSALQEKSARATGFRLAQVDLEARLTGLRPLPVARAAQTAAPAAGYGRGPSTRPRAVRTHSTTETLREPDADWRLSPLVWITVAVLALLFAISVGTVLSIVRPVRALTLATRSLAQGQWRTLPSGGAIRELDELTQAFNEMAERLSHAQSMAREYHQQLEAKVEERTRQLQDLAANDPLTQLPNRRQFFTHLNEAIRSAQTGNRRIGLLFLDLDNFKTINDSMGHVFGDRVLQALAARLRETCAGFGVASRLGGDEFTVTLVGLNSPEEIMQRAGQVLTAFQDPLGVDGRSLSVSLSLGVGIYPDHEQDAEALLRAADAALFLAKAEGKNRISVFSTRLLEAAAARFTTEQSLRTALEQGEFELHFQPEVNAATGTVDVVEALLRWRLADGRVLTPEVFLTVAEESGLIGHISRWVVETAMSAAARWHHGDWPDVRLAINVSSRQLIDSDCVERFASLASRLRLPPRCIEFELTENVLQTGPATIAALRGLRAAGFGIALDDFGTGYSSLVSLEQLPLTRVKLDRALIASIDQSARSMAIARSIIGLCESLSLEITAEGVERREQLLPLLNARRMYVQGYLLSKAVPEAAVAARRLEIEARWHSITSSPAVPALDATGSFSRRLRALPSAAGRSTAS